MAKDYDNAYKYLFSNKRIFYQLIQSFVKEDFIKDISLENIELMEKSFVSDEFLSRESDIIYKIKLKESEVYIYVLLEFQSTVDKSIPIRMLLYILQFYDLLLRNSQKGLLPAVFPLLLYNGEANWTIPTNVKALVDHQIPEKYIPSFEYYKIIEKDIPDTTLEKLHNLVSAVIYLEKRKDKAGLEVVLDKIVEMIREEEMIDIRMFTIWFKRMFRQKVEPEESAKINNIMEVKDMLTLLADRIKLEGKLEGKLETAKKMKAEGLDLDLIRRVTGLSKEEIEKV